MRRCMCHPSPGACHYRDRTAIHVRTHHHRALLHAVEQDIVADIFFFDHIADGVSEEVKLEVAFVGFGMQSVGVIPSDVLASGGMISTRRATEAFGTQAQIAWVTTY